MKITIWVAPSPKQCSPDLALSKTVFLPFFSDLLRKRLKSRHRNRESGRAPEIDARKLSISLPISPLHDSAHFPEARHTGWSSDLHTLSVFVSKRSEMKLWWGRKEFSTKKTSSPLLSKIHPAFFETPPILYTHDSGQHVALFSCFVVTGTCEIAFLELGTEFSKPKKVRSVREERRRSMERKNAKWKRERQRKVRRKISHGRRAIE